MRVIQEEGHCFLGRERDQSEQNQSANVLFSFLRTRIVVVLQRGEEEEDKAKRSNARRLSIK